MVISEYIVSKHLISLSLSHTQTHTCLCNECYTLCNSFAQALASFVPNFVLRQCYMDNDAEHLQHADSSHRKKRRDKKSRGPSSRRFEGVAMIVDISGFSKLSAELTSTARTKERIEKAIRYYKCNPHRTNL